MSTPVRVIPFERVRMRDLAQVGGKNASLGEMIGELANAGIRVPGGFATTADAFREFLAQDGLAAKIERTLASVDVDDVRELARAGEAIRGWIGSTPLPDPLVAAIGTAYETLAGGNDSLSFAVRSSATAEDLPDASFAGQQDTLLISAACRTYCKLFLIYLRRFTTTAPSLTAPIMASPTATWRCRWACSGWFAAIRRPPV
jgi:Phosphoenolpyruvate synthase/pyruvate phosphate dikinase